MARPQFRLPAPFLVAILPGCSRSADRLRSSATRRGPSACDAGRVAHGGAAAGGETYLEGGARAVRDAAGAGGHECRQPLPGLRPGDRGADPRDQERRSGSVAAEPRQAVGCQGRHAQTARRAFLRVTPEEIVITRNTSESNNVVSNGLDLKAGDEVLIFADNHPSNHQAWLEKAKRFGFSVVTVEQKNPHPGAGVLHRRLHPRDHAADQGDGVHTSHQHGRRSCCRPKELCRVARERGVLSMLDGAQSFGLLDVDLVRHPARLLLRQRAQVALRRARVRRALHQRPRTRSHLALVVQRLPGRRWRLAQDGSLRTAR